MGERSASSERGESPERDKSASPDLEPRRDAATREEELRQRVAIYLIEREAIELRRQRWAHLYQPAGEPMSVSDRERLAKYDRPKTRPGGDGAPSRMRRVGSWLKSLLVGA